MKFSKYHALGNDYLVISANELSSHRDVQSVVRICHRHFGIGSDGILVDQGVNSSGTFSLQILNPDGSEAEKSGNGLRIFARHLWDSSLVQEKPFSVQTKGGLVHCQVLNAGKEVEVEMGSVTFFSNEIPVAGSSREVLNESIVVDGKTFTFSAASVGNPHCVIVQANAIKSDALRYGPLLECHENFPNRTNVQFLEVLDRNNIRIEIWERGAGYTLASGSSSSASAAVAHRLGLCDQNITVHMPGGSLAITIEKDYSIRMRGAVTRVSEGRLYDEMFSWNAET